MKKPESRDLTQELAQVMHVLGWHSARETRVQCATRMQNEARDMRGEIAMLRGQSERRRKERDAAQAAQKVAEGRVDALLRQIRKLAASGTALPSEAVLAGAAVISPSESLRRQTAVWDEFERIRKEHEGAT